MSKPFGLASLLFATTALVAPSTVWAQETPTAPVEAAAAPTTDGQDAAAQPAEEPLEISTPGGNPVAANSGGDIIVRGRRNANQLRTAPQVVSVLSAADIARTGEGNIAGALGRVTGLSVVGNGYVYVRGLGDRYSLALLNGSPLPSPEPLRRTVPLDIFPSGVIASSLVQKSYSANYPGEFGGGVINLTTRAVPRDPFLSFGIGISGDTVTTGQLGYTYFGSKSDWTGFDNGSRNIPSALRAYLDSGAQFGDGSTAGNGTPVAAQLINARNSLVQRNNNIPVNTSVSLSGAKSWDIGDAQLGLIVGAGYSNRWTTRETLQQRSLTADLSTIESSFNGVNTDNRIVVNALVGLGLEFGENRLRWTNLYIRDTIKQARLSVGRQNQTNVDYLRQNTGWYERQLIDTQLVGEFRLTPELSLDVRGAFANSQREAPFENFFEYVRTNPTGNPSTDLAANYVNRLNNGQSGDARIAFSDLNEDLWSTSADLTYRAVPGLSFTVGGAFSNTVRNSARRRFIVGTGGICTGTERAPLNCIPNGVTLLRPDLLLAPNVVNAFGISLVEEDPGNPSSVGRLRNAAGYGKVTWQFTDQLNLDAGVRYEWARLSATPLQAFNSRPAGAEISQTRSYWLPSATLTWEIQPQMQVRFSASKTIARPQFRELISQTYYDPDSNREYRGNPLLTDTQLYNAEARFEYYFAPEQRLSVAGFYKRLDNPIESFLNRDFILSYANAPQATLYGAEFELQKYFNIAESGFFASRRFLVIANYTYTHSVLQVQAGDRTQVFGAGANGNVLATDYFRDGVPLTGQSDHIVNLQLGFEDSDRLSQQTLLISYASDRSITRGVFGSSPQPDVIERPGVRIDLVAREGVTVFGQELELKFEARNITGQRHTEFQQSGANRLENNSYNVGTSFALSGTLRF